MDIVELDAGGTGRLAQRDLAVAVGKPVVLASCRGGSGWDLPVFGGEFGAHIGIALGGDDGEQESVGAEDEPGGLESRDREQATVEVEVFMQS